MLARPAYAIALALLLAWRGAAAQEGESRHEGYYYPKPATVEVYPARVETLPETGRSLRLGFVTGLTKQLGDANYAPYYAVFAKGDEAEKLIIVGMIDGQLDTIYRARGLFATFTAQARLTPFFREHTAAEQATFFDLLKLLGFDQVTVTDGVAFAHQVLIE